MRRSGRRVVGRPERHHHRTSATCEEAVLQPEDLLTVRHTRATGVARAQHHQGSVQIERRGIAGREPTVGPVVCPTAAGPGVGRGRARPGCTTLDDPAAVPTRSRVAAPPSRHTASGSSRDRVRTSSTTPGIPPSARPTSSAGPSVRTRPAHARARAGLAVGAHHGAVDERRASARQGPRTERRAAVRPGRSRRRAARRPTPDPSGPRPARATVHRGGPCGRRPP